MDNKVRPRISHYDALGLSADAGEGEIAQAFARKMSPFEAHAPGEAARICAAYETLRNPAKRRDYDRSLGLARPEPRQWTFAVSQQRWPGFVGIDGGRRRRCDASRRGAAGGGGTAGNATRAGARIRDRRVAPQARRTRAVRRR